MNSGRAGEAHRLEEDVVQLLITCLLVWAGATASASAVLLVVVAVQRVARALGGRRTALPHGVPYPASGAAGGRNMARA